MINIKVFSDYACPFCYIGFSIANKLRKEREDVDFTYYPYILAPELSLSGGDLSDSIPQDRIDMSYKRIQRLGSEYGLVYNNKTKKFNTNRLHRAALYAQEEGKFYEFSEAAFRYIFEYGKNLGDPLILNELALSLELDIIKMNEEIDSGKFEKQMDEAKILSEKYQIESVPTFIVNDEREVTTLKDYERFKKDLIE